MPVVLAGMAEAARLLSGERIRWKPVAVAAVAVAAGLALHPNGANLVRFGWLVVARVLVENAWGALAGLEIGGSSTPSPPGSGSPCSRWSQPLPTGALVAVALLYQGPRRRRSWVACGSGPTAPLPTWQR